MADFVLGRLKFHFKGSWTTSTAYIKDDVVTYGGNSFVCLVNHTAAADFYTDLSHATSVAINGRRYRLTEVIGQAQLFRVDDIVTTVVQHIDVIQVTQDKRLV